MTLTITSTVVSHSAILRLAGDLDLEHVDEVLDAVSRLITGRSSLRALHVDCSGLTHCDLNGLSALLQIRRDTAAAGIRLHLEDRPDFLDRLFDVAGVVPHLTAHRSDAPMHRPAAPLRSGRRDVDSSPGEISN